MSGRDWVLTNEQILEAPLDVLGLEIPKDVLINRQTTSSQTWLLMAKNAGTFSTDRFGHSARAGSGSTAMALWLPIG